VRPAVGDQLRLVPGTYLPRLLTTIERDVQQKITAERFPATPQAGLIVRETLSRHPYSGAYAAEQGEHRVRGGR